MGELGREAMEVSNGRQLHVGDRVLFNGIHRPGVRGVRRVENGTPAVVVGVDVERGQVELELFEPNRGQRRLVLGADAPVDLGYARHVVKAQGVTAELAEGLELEPAQLQATLAPATAPDVDGPDRESRQATQEGPAFEERAVLPAGLYPAEVAALQRARAAGAPPLGAMTASELRAGIAADQARREAEQAVTLGSAAGR